MDWTQIFSNTAASIVSPVTLAYALGTVGLAVHFGFAGLLNMGIAGFMAIGSYGYAISVLTFGLPWWAAMLVALLASAVFALILGLPTLRLRGDYLAIVTIAAAEVVRLLFLTSAFDDITGSADGLTAYNGDFRASNILPEGTYGFGPFAFTAVQWQSRIFGIVSLLVVVAIVFFLVRSPWGRVIKGIREDEDAVRSLGKNVFKYKMQALILGGMIAALGGIVYALPSSVNPGVYVTSLTFFVYTALLLGGAATVFGPVIGSVIFWILQAFLGGVLPALGELLDISTTQAQTLRFVLVGVALMLIVIFRPQGILGNKKELTFVK